MYAKGILTSFLFVAVVCGVSLPALVWSTNIETSVYLQTCIVISFTLVTMWFVAAEKLLLLGKEQGGKDGAALLRIRRQSSDYFEANDKHDDENEKATTCALTIGKVYEDFGLVDKCIEVYSEGLKKYRFEPRHPGMELIGGYTRMELDSFNHVALASILRLFIAKGKAICTASSITETKYSAEKVYIDALEVYENCKSADELLEHSIVFPIFSGLFVLIKGGKCKRQDEKFEFERKLCSKFVKAAKLHADPVHYTRALAMKAEVDARRRHFEDALDSFATLKTIYDATEHSEAISEAYGTDRTAQAYSSAILWNRYLGRNEEATRLNTYVIEELLPKMDLQNIHNTVMLLLPVLKFLKYNGEFARAKHLFESNVWQNFVHYMGEDGKTPCVEMFKPLIHLIDVLIHGEKMPNLRKVIEWVATENNGEANDFIDAAMTSWSAHSITAELCWELSKLAPDASNDQEASYKEKLEQKSLRLARKCSDRMVDWLKREVKLPVLFEDCERVLLALDVEYEPINRKRVSFSV